MVAPFQTARTPTKLGAIATDEKVPEAAVNVPPSDEAAVCGVATTFAWLFPHMTIVRVAPAGAWRADGGHAAPGATCTVETIASVTFHTQTEAFRPPSPPVASGESALTFSSVATRTSHNPLAFVDPSSTSTL